MCNEIAMQGFGTHKNSFLAAMWLEMLVLLHYTERGRGPQVRRFNRKCRSGCNFGAHGLRFSVPKRGHDHQELLVLQSETNDSSI